MNIRLSSQDFFRSGLDLVNEDDQIKKLVFMFDQDLTSDSNTLSINLKYYCKHFLTLKFPILSAIIPATGGIKMATTGVTADMMAVSSTFIPSSRM